MSIAERIYNAKQEIKAIDYLIDELYMKYQDETISWMYLTDRKKAYELEKAELRSMIFRLNQFGTI